ncbi:hypothetical protein CIG11343_0479 [Campylobacter iguaniorum]|uniref:hypothetical protein n=1 Tax=Campylobacter iguaniorum TaxID=1244531 RepID=UPI0007C89C62|nr:hypothetical protein [Campylobacter iguaniorum]ANE35560.1 hypothetical protein CIG11343_0479 [Campylobacter iguaniorum]
MISIATKQDAKSVIELLNLAMEDIAFSLTSNLEQSNQILQEFFTQKGNRLSYENILVYRLDSKVVGAICFQKALNLGLDKVSLIVDTKKEKTKKYYESLGFAAVGKKCIANHEYTYMIKDLK